MKYGGKIKLYSLSFSKIGCGAIGCEMLKNYAMIGVGTGTKGKVSVASAEHDILREKQSFWFLSV